MMQMDRANHGKKIKDPAGTRVLVNFYLFSYNLAQVFGWSYLLYLTVDHLVHGRPLHSLWPVVKSSVVIFQNAALIEIVNVALGFVKSNLMITTFQVFSRVMVVCGVLLATPTAPVSYGLPLLLIAWSVTEVIRYLFYALNILNIVPHLLVWTRYTFFYVLYPLGVTGELLCLYAAQQWVAESKLWSYELPNPANFTFSYRYFLLGVMALYPPLFPKMYLHMISQRKKVIGGSASTSPKKKSK